MPTIKIPCIGILWNSLDKEQMDEAIRMLEDEEFGDCPMYSAEDLENAVRLLGVALKKDNPQIEDYIYSLHKLSSTLLFFTLL